MVFESLLQDLRLGARLLFKDRTFCLIATLVLALGVCGVTTQLTIIKSLLFGLLPFTDSERLVAVTLRHPAGIGFTPQPDAGGSVRLGDYFDIAREQRSFTELAGYIPGTYPATIDGMTARFDGTAVSHNFFRLLDVRPILGRDFSAEDDQRGAEGVVIISMRLWEEAFGRDPGILQRTIRLGEETRAIIGVMPEGFRFPRSDFMWIPLNSLAYPFDVAPTARVLFRNVGTIGRLRPDITREQARMEITAIAQRLAAAYPDTNGSTTFVTVEPLADVFLSSQFRQTLYAMLAAVLVVLIIASVNVMNLQLARATPRIREMAVRSALGATRARLLRQVMTESALVAFLGATTGVALSWACSRLLRGLVTSEGRGSGVAPPWASLSLDGQVLGLTIAIVTVVVVVSGMVPAWYASRTNAAHAIKEGGRGVASGFFNRIARGLVIAQIAFTGPLLFGSLLMTRSLANQRNFDWGYNAESLATNRISIRGTNYSGGADRLAFQDNLLRNLHEDPLFTQAALTSRGPALYLAGANSAYEIEGEDYPDAAARPVFLYDYVSATYFRTIGVPILYGRDFVPSDIASEQSVAIVNASFVRNHFRNGEPIGKRLRWIGSNSRPGPWMTIIGVVPDMSIVGPVPAAPEHVPGVSFLIGTPAGIPPEVSIVVRGQAAPEALARGLAAHVTRLDPELTLYGPTMTPKQRLLLSLRQRSNLTMVFCAFGLASVVLATAGLYGVTAFSVTQRTQEFGIRMALGASHREIIRLIFRQGAVQLAVGGILGVALAVVIVRITRAYSRTFLYQVDPLDPPAIGATVLLLASASALACLPPARRATTVDPIETLRAE